MEIYSVVNVENLKPFKPSMLDDEPSKTLPHVEDLVTDQEKPLEEDTTVKKQ